MSPFIDPAHPLNRHGPLNPLNWAERQHKLPIAPTSSPPWWIWLIVVCLLMCMLLPGIIYECKKEIEYRRKQRKKP